MPLEVKQNPRTVGANGESIPYKEVLLRDAASKAAEIIEAREAVREGRPIPSDAIRTKPRWAPNVGLEWGASALKPDDAGHLPAMFSFLAFGAVPLARGMAKEPVLRRPWAYPVAAAVGYFFGTQVRNWQRWEIAESERLLQLLQEKDRKLHAATKGRLD